MNRSTQIGYKVFSELVTRVISFAIVVLSVRLLVTEEFGVFSLAWTAGWMISLISDFGLQLFLTREVARRPSEAWSIFRHLFRIRLGVSGCVLAAVFLIGALSGWPAYSGAFLALIAAQVGVSLIEFLNYFYRGLSRSDLESSFNLIQRLLALALVAVLLTIHPSVVNLALALLVATLLTLGWSVHLSVKLGRGIQEAQGQTPEPVSLSVLFRQVLPIGLGIVLSSLYFRIDVFLIEWWKGTESVALYSAVFRLVEGLRLFPAAVLAVVFPELCRDFSWKTLGWTCLGLLGLGAAVGALSARWAAVLIEVLYGQSYLQAVDAFKILLLALPLLFLNFALTHQLMAWGLQRFYALLCAGALLCNLGMNWILIPRLSIGGAAWSTLGTEVFLTAGCALILIRKGAPGVESFSEALSMDALNR